MSKGFGGGGGSLRRSGLRMDHCKWVGGGSGTFKWRE